MGAEDQPFYYAARSRSLYDQAIAAAKTTKLKGIEYKQFIENFVKNPPEKSLETAVKDAEIAAFQNKTVLGSLLSKIQNPLAKFISEIITPLRTTPSAVGMQLINYSPVGIAKTILENIGKGRFDQRAFSEGIARGLTGTAIMSIGKKLFEKGLMTLSAPTNEAERNQWELEGKKPNSILVNGKWRSLNGVSPAGNILITGGYFGKGMRDTNDPTKAMATASAGAGRALTDQTFLKGISGVLNAFNDPARYGQIFMENTAGSTIPTISSDIAQVTDPLQRQSNSVVDAMRARIHGLRKSLLPKQDTFGNDIPRAEGPLGTMADPFRSSPQKNDTVTERLRQLLDAGEGATPSKIPKTLKVSGEQVNLTPKQRYDLQKYIGQKAKDAFSSLFESKDFSELPEEDQKKILTNIHSDIVTSAKKEFWGDKKTNRVRPVYDQLQQMIQQGEQDEADRIAGEMPAEDYKLYKQIKTAEKSKDTAQRTANMLPVALSARFSVRSFINSICTSLHEPGSHHLKWLGPSHFSICSSKVPSDAARIVKGILNENNVVNMRMQISLFMEFLPFLKGINGETTI